MPIDPDELPIRKKPTEILLGADLPFAAGFVPA
jgi:hypothetical protein